MSVLLQKSGLGREAYARIDAQGLARVSPFEPTPGSSSISAFLVPRPLIHCQLARGQKARTYPSATLHWKISI